MSTATTTELEAYAERVRAALADLPPTERDGLLDDLDDHLAEVAAEDGGGALVDRLGPPETYAAELRAAAGLPPATVAPDRRRRLPDLRTHPWTRATVDFLPRLLPGWWVLRGLLVPLSLGWWDTPDLTIVLLAVLLVPLSVTLGLRGPRDARLRWVDHAATGVALAAGLLAVVTWGEMRASAGSDHTVHEEPGWPRGNGVTNIHPYSSDGRPLTDVLLYDQDGNPILVGRTDADGNPISSVPRYSADGEIVDNVYPQEQTVEDIAVTIGSGEDQPRRRVTPPTVTPPALQPR